LSLKKKDDNIVVFDSNFILLPYQFKIDYLNDIYLNLEGKTRFYIFKQSLDEIEAKIRRDPKTRKLKRQYKGGMAYLDKNEKIYPLYFIKEIKENNETTDEFLLKWCRKFKKEYKKVYLATNDSELRKKAKNSNVNIIFLRQQKFLVIERS
jgi:rRNA-processing protein FCF1